MRKEKSSKKHLSIMQLSIMTLLSSFVFFGVWQGIHFLVTQSVVSLGDELGMKMVFSVLFGFLFFGVSFIYGFLTQSKKSKIQKEQFLTATGCAEMSEMKHISGLPVTEGCVCQVGISPTQLVFQREEKLITLPMERILDVTIKTDTEVRTHYVSDAGAAVAGGMLFGAVGAAVGGSPQKITETKVSKFLIVTYHDGSAVGNIFFGVDQYPFAWSIVNYYEKLPKAQRNISM